MSLNVPYIHLFFQVAVIPTLYTTTQDAIRLLDKCPQGALQVVQLSFLDLEICFRHQWAPKDTLYVDWRIQSSLEIY